MLKPGEAEVIKLWWADSPSLRGGLFVIGAMVVSLISGTIVVLAALAFTQLN